MDPTNFTRSYIDVVDYISNKDPIFAEYLLAKFPSSLKMDPRTRDNVFNKKTQWLSGRGNNSGQSSSVVIPYDTFNQSVYELAKVYTDGSDGVQRNYHRANKFIRILKLLGDERCGVLQTKNKDLNIQMKKKYYKQNKIKT